MSKDSNEPADLEAADNAEQELDARGLYCPEPVMLLHNKIRDIAAGDVLRLIATDPSTTRDVPKFCLYLGHELIDSKKEGDLYHYLIKKKDD
jgi:tRNA 2-thiouridine synthesizing protein A